MAEAVKICGVRFRRFNPLSPGLPRERKLCLVLLPSRKCSMGEDPETVAVGFLRRTGKRGGAWWCIPGVGGKPSHYADCLGDDFPSRAEWAKLAKLRNAP